MESNFSSARYPIAAIAWSCPEKSRIVLDNSLLAVDFLGFARTRHTTARFHGMPAQYRVAAR